MLRDEAILGRLNSGDAFAGSVENFRVFLFLKTLLRIFRCLLNEQRWIVLSGRRPDGATVARIGCSGFARGFEDKMIFLVEEPLLLGVGRRVSPIGDQRA